MLIPDELYFNNMSKFLNIEDFTNMLLVDKQIKIYNTNSNWNILLHSKYPQYHEIIIKFNNINENLIKELIHVLDIIIEEEKKEFILKMGKKEKEFNKQHRYDYNNDKVFKKDVYEHILNLNKLFIYSCRYNLTSLSKFIIINIDRDILFRIKKVIEEKDDEVEDDEFEYEKEEEEVEVEVEEKEEEIIKYNVEAINEICKNNNNKMYLLFKNALKDTGSIEYINNYSLYYTCLHGTTDFFTFIFKDKLLINDVELKNCLFPPKERKSALGRNYISDPRIKPFTNLIYPACEGGNLDIIKLFFKHLKLPIQTIDSLLAKSSKYGHLHIVKYLIEDDEVKEMRDKLYGDPDFIKYEYKNGKNKEKKWIRYINQAFSNACSEGHFDIMIYLLKNPNVDVTGDNFDNFPIKSSCHNGHTKIAKYLLETEGIKDLIDPTDTNNAALQGACGNRHYEIIKMLLNDGRSDPLSNENICLNELCHNFNGDTKCLQLFLNDTRVQDFLKKDNNNGNNLLNETCYYNSTIEILEIILNDPNINFKKQENDNDDKENKHDEVLEKISSNYNNNLNISVMLIENKKLNISCKQIMETLDNISYCHYSNVEYETPINNILDVLKTKKDIIEFEKDFIENICQNGLFSVLKKLIEEFNVIPEEYMLEYSIRMRNTEYLEQIKFLLKYINPSKMDDLMLNPCQNLNMKVIKVLLEDPRIIVTISQINQAQNGFYSKEDKKTKDDIYDVVILLLKSSNFKYGIEKDDNMVLGWIREYAEENNRPDILEETEKYL